jgi:hypothetical protein
MGEELGNQIGPSVSILELESGLKQLKDHRFLIVSPKVIQLGSNWLGVGLAERLGLRSSSYTGGLHLSHGLF